MGVSHAIVAAQRDLLRVKGQGDVRKDGASVVLAAYINENIYEWGKWRLGVKEGVSHHELGKCAMSRLSNKHANQELSRCTARYHDASWSPLMGDNGGLSIKKSVWRVHDPSSSHGSLTHE